PPHTLHSFPTRRSSDLTYPDNSYQAWTYDNAKNMITRRTVNGVTQNFTYDNRNRKITMSWSNGLDSATFGYDAASRLISATNPRSEEHTSELQSLAYLV